MPGPVVLAIDIGSSSVRASLYDRQLRTTRTHQVGYRWEQHPDGRIELAADRLERIVIKAVDGILRPPPVVDVEAVAVAAFWHSLMGVDTAGRATTPLVPWSDLRAERHAARLREAVDERRVHARTGCRLHASYWPARLRWFRSREPRAFSRTVRWMGFGEWLEQRWLGRTAISVSQASGTGLMDQRSCSWDPEMIRVSKIVPEALAPIVDLDHRAGGLGRPLAARWPCLARARWLPVVGDGAANNVGAGCTVAGRAALMIGTSGAIRVLWEPRSGERVRTPFGLWRYRLDGRRIVVGGALSSGGNVRDWTIRTFRAGRAIDAEALALAPDSHSLTVLPFLAGTRSPDYLSGVRGAITGLSIGTTPAHVLRAMMEAVGYRLAVVLEELDRAVAVRELVAAGGVLERSEGWAQVLADILGRPVTMSGERDLTSRGAAALALEQLDVLDVSRLAPRRSGIVRPDSRRHAIYARALLRHRKFCAMGTGSLRGLSL